MTSLNSNRILGYSGLSRALKLLISFVIMTQAGCFGPRSMNHDIDAYNRDYLEAEKSMLLYNIGLLRNDQPPHFMMLTSVNQTRTFSANASFQWAHLWNSLFIPFNGPGVVNNGAITTKGSDTYSVGPLTAGAVESPTYVFTPIQGQDFANRFETPLTDKFTKFLEDQRWASTDQELADIVRLFVESLWLNHGEAGPQAVCTADALGSLYLNRRPSEFPGLQDELGGGYLAFDRCVNHILNDETLNYTIIDGAAHQVPTAVAGKPGPADLVTALGAGYEWTKNGGDFVLSNPVRLPAWLDYDPTFTPSPKEKSDLDKPGPAFWFGTKSASSGTIEAPDLSKLAANYSWKRTDTGQYILVPDGYVWDATTGLLAKEPPSIPLDQPSYANEIVRVVWPVPQDYFYVELRHEKSPSLSDKQVEKVCVDQAPTAAPRGNRGPDSSTQNLKMLVPEHRVGATPTKIAEDPAVGNVVCGYFKVANLLETLKHLAKKACDENVTHYSNDPDTDCSQSIFGVGPTAPSWAHIATDYTYPRKGDGKPVTESIWMPAHNPSKPEGQRDERVFLLVYKLYQMSLVDTSKLVTGNVPITISK